MPVVTRSQTKAFRESRDAGIKAFHEARDARLRESLKENRSTPTNVVSEPKPLRKPPTKIVVPARRPVTRSQTKALHEAEEKRFQESINKKSSAPSGVAILEKIQSEMAELIRIFPNKRVVRQASLLSSFMDNTEPLLEPAIEFISKNLDRLSLRMFTILHNHILYLSTELRQYGSYKSWFKATNYSHKITNFLKLYNPKIIIQHSLQNRIAKYVIGKDVIDFSNDLSLN